MPRTDVPAAPLRFRSFETFVSVCFSGNVGTTLRLPGPVSALAFCVTAFGLAFTLVRFRAGCFGNSTCAGSGLLTASCTTASKSISTLNLSSSGAGCVLSGTVAALALGTGRPIPRWSGAVMSGVLGAAAVGLTAPLGPTGGTLTPLAAVSVGLASTAPSAVPKGFALSSAVTAGFAISLGCRNSPRNDSCVGRSLSCLLRSGSVTRACISLRPSSVSTSMSSCFCRAASVALRTRALSSRALSCSMRLIKSGSVLGCSTSSTCVTSGAGSGLPYLRSSCSRSNANRSGCSNASTSPRSAAANA